MALLLLGQDLTECVRKLSTHTDERFPVRTDPPLGKLSQDFQTSLGHGPYQKEGMTK